MDGGQVNAGAKVITAEQWAQCENPSCEKWRLLPPGTVLNENEPWYCYMILIHRKIHVMRLKRYVF